MPYSDLKHALPSAAERRISQDDGRFALGRIATFQYITLAVFLFLYAAVYGPAVAFYEPTSGTGTTRFLLAHVAPLLFVISMFFESPSCRDRRWRLAGAEIGPPHISVLLLATIGLDLTFTFWPRLMTTYGGF